MLLPAPFLRASGGRGRHKARRRGAQGGRARGQVGRRQCYRRPSPAPRAHPPRPGKSDGPSPPAARRRFRMLQTPGVTSRPGSSSNGSPTDDACPRSSPTGSHGRPPWPCQWEAPVRRPAGEPPQRRADRSGPPGDRRRAGPMGPPPASPSNRPSPEGRGAAGP